MFQPTNESYIRCMIEATLYRYDDETEEERVLRQEQPHHPGSASRRTYSLLMSLAHWVIGLGAWFAGSNQTSVTTLR